MNGDGIINSLCRLRIMSTEQRKLDLEIRELELKIEQLSRKPQQKPAFWFSTITVAVAVLGLFAQGYLSSITSERAELQVERAEKLRNDANERLVELRNEFANWTSLVRPLRSILKYDLNQLRMTNLSIAQGFG